MDIRKIVLSREELLAEGGERPSRPVHRAVGIAR
jgi:hypothetical protein